MSKAQHFEAIKYSLRQSKDGVVVAFVVQPEDVRPELLALPVGARVMIAWCAVGDDEKPELSPPVKARETALHADPKADGSKAERRPFHTLPLSAQCAIRCSDKQFWTFLRELHGAIVDDAVAADATVKGLLRITSKKEIDTGTARHGWQDIEKQFKAWLTDAHYAEYAR